MAKKKGGLGRGLDALFADAAPLYEEERAEESAETRETRSLVREAAESAKEKKTGKSRRTAKSPRTAAKSPEREPSDAAEQVLYLDINDIRPNRDQPRKTFDEDKLRELAKSIQENGVIQPLIVRETEAGYELVAGERRWRASRIAGLRKLPCLVRDFDERQNMVVSIIENMQREDLDAIEEAMGLRAMIQRFGFTQEQVSGALGKSRAYIANSLRLLKLPQAIQDLIRSGQISPAHGRTLITVEDPATQAAICKKVVREGLSVRATERLADKAKDDARPARPRRNTKRDPEMAAAESELRSILGTKVSIRGTARSGRVELEYYSLDELNRLIEMLRSIR